MLNHSDGKTLGNTKRHCKVYRRENDFYDFLRSHNLSENYDEKSIDNLLLLEGKENHYKELYELRNFEIEEFFKIHGPSRLIVINLDDPLKWVKLGRFFNIKINDDYEVHENKS